MVSRSQNTTLPVFQSKLPEIIEEMDIMAAIFRAKPKVRSQRAGAHFVSTSTGFLQAVVQPIEIPLRKSQPFAVSTALGEYTANISAAIHP